MMQRIHEVLRTLTASLIQTFVSYYIRFHLYWWPAPSQTAEQYEKEAHICSYEDFIKAARTGDLVMTGGDYRISQFTRSKTHCKTSHAIVVYKEGDETAKGTPTRLFGITSFLWGHLPKRSQAFSELMVCGHEGIVHDGPQMHPLDLFCDGTMMIENNWLIWRPLMAATDHSHANQYDDDMSAFRVRFRPSAGSTLQNVPPERLEAIKAKVHSTSRGFCGSPFPNPKEMYSRKAAILSLNDLRRLSKLGRPTAQHCTEVCARTLIEAGIMRDHLSTENLTIPPHAFTNGHMESGGIMDRKFMSDALAYGPDIWVRKPVISCFEADGTPKVDAYSHLPPVCQAKKQKAEQLNTGSKDEEKESANGNNIKTTATLSE